MVAKLVFVFFNFFLDFNDKSILSFDSPHFAERRILLWVLQLTNGPVEILVYRLFLMIYVYYTRITIQTLLAV